MDVENCRLRQFRLKPKDAWLLELGYKTTGPQEQLRKGEVWGKKIDSGGTGTS